MVGALEPTILPGVPLRIANGRFGNAEPKVTFLCSLSSGGNARQVWRVWDTGERRTQGLMIHIVFLFFIFFSFPNAEKKEK